MLWNGCRNVFDLEVCCAGYPPCFGSRRDQASCRSECHVSKCIHENVVRGLHRSPPRKVRPGSVGSQANPILPACLHRHTTVEERGSTGSPASALSGYLFVCVDANERLPVVQTAGVVSIVGNGTSPVPVDDQEIHALRIGAQRASLMPHPVPRAGDTVCIKRGPFQGVRGHVQRDRGNLTFVVTIQLIQRSFAIGVQACDLELAG